MEQTIMRSYQPSISRKTVITKKIGCAVFAVTSTEKKMPRPVLNSLGESDASEYSWLSGSPRAVHYGPVPVYGFVNNEVPPIRFGVNIYNNNRLGRGPLGGPHEHIPGRLPPFNFGMPDVGNQGIGQRRNGPAILDLGELNRSGNLAAPLLDVGNQGIGQRRDGPGFLNLAELNRSGNLAAPLLGIGNQAIGQHRDGPAGLGLAEPNMVGRGNLAPPLLIGNNRAACVDRPGNPCPSSEWQCSSASALPRKQGGRREGGRLRLLGIDKKEEKKSFASKKVSRASSMREEDDGWGSSKKPKNGSEGGRSGRGTSFFSQSVMYDPTKKTPECFFRDEKPRQTKGSGSFDKYQPLKTSGPKTLVLFEDKNFVPPRNQYNPRNQLPSLFD
ncbi:unnamed protein product [Caenorhabditis auriculariae]|uniref:Uncharacterized protein n=1 Tax=Caenorhabditis auriculariae TaxID=2777116 RepID=A0A8S1H0H5_9PELO|nr:unnamed protein product [Caenorhabditis auriculariae]